MTICYIMLVDLLSKLLVHCLFGSYQQTICFIVHFEQTICFIVCFDILSQPGQMHFFPSRLGLGLLEPAKAEFEVLFIIILSHLVNITPSSFTLIHKYPLVTGCTIAHRGSGAPVRHPKSSFPLEGQLRSPMRHQTSVHPQESQLKIFNPPFLRSPKKLTLKMLIDWFQSTIAVEKAPKI